ncbi:hypothetical protein TVAG_548710 [Trichomonas vaginalis G3]|uniref:GPI mannosyltransferase 2 n=1 Tax=Trichomonas vaginalis (strain ATCC PRA-98 / G3) TaxID=412133 RepID=A2GN69_TRIV3|nr:dolichyl-phosphate-mannose-glycolipid alpha-mannosyltransferase protein [Trichomonas vaginalis G3]EAX81398.1 hypothetical protein TVAG_548710 [Trichomonas vaginalis G3]KAI5490759.1 dolichyl-phosphate-mannose-glycolipid alpha-mannosyltransferase protein [Trichomonas vaginalis G3]|eukprot:XP_001294328.1 hypothetical protein [Trichomonas vaginalis G3]
MKNNKTKIPPSNRPKQGFNNKLPQESVSNTKREKSLWALDRDDLICSLTMVASIFCVWCSAAYYGSLNSILCYWDGPNYLYAGETLYKIPKDNPWTLQFQYPPSYFACHLPGYPLFIRIFSTIFFGNYILGFYFSIIAESLLFIYTFRRLLIVYQCVENPLFSTIATCFLPVRFLIYHSVGASEPLYLTSISLSFIFYKQNRFWLMMLSVWLGCFTRIEGMAVGFAIGLCYLVSLRIFRAFGMFLTFVSTIILLGFHQYRFHNPFAYIDFNSGSQKLIKWPPLNDAYYVQPEVFYSYGALGSFFIFLMGSLLIFEKCPPLATYCVVHMIYVSLLFHIDVFRYQIPASVFAVAIGYEKLFRPKIYKIIMLILLPFYMFVTLSYAGQQINSNMAWPQFMEQIYASIENVKSGKAEF